METRYDLLPTHGLEEVHKIFTKKLEKYKEHQWKQGVEWSSVLSSINKHLNAFSRGQDYTDDNLYHIAEVAANALILCELYNIYPQGDNRIIKPAHDVIIGLDLDNVVFDFNTAYESRFNCKMNPFWAASYDMGENLKILENEKEFWVNLPVLHRPVFEVDYYVTARNIPIEWTEEALQKNGMPCAPVLSVGWDESKVKLIKDHNINLMIDDKFTNYKEITEAGVFCYLMDAPHNQYYDVGHRRIFDLNKPLK